MIRSLLAARGWHGQMARYAISGGALTLLYSAVYWTLAEPLAVPALLANTVAFLVNLAVGWAIHSRWSFAGHGPDVRPRAAYGRFFLVNIAGYALNSFWVWLIVERLQGSVTASLIPIVLATPLFMFWANRRWTFS
jgi:putative flippase GtrA